jgi:hypothetical protein
LRGVSTHELPYPAVGRRRLRDDLLAYLRDPGQAVARGPLPDLTWAKLLALQFLSLIIAAPFLALGFALVQDEQYTADEGVPAIAVFFLAVVVAPVVEEAAFRLVLTRFRGPYLIIGGAALGAMSAALPLAIAVPMLALSAALIIIGVVGAGAAAARERLRALWARVFGWLFYGSAVAFALFHLGNYDLGSIGAVAVLAAPLLVTSQFLGGLLLGYARVRLGIVAAMGQHAAYNFLLVTPALLFGGL